MFPARVAVNLRNPSLALETAELHAAQTHEWLIQIK